MALALTLYEDSLCPYCGQDKHEAMDPDFADEWTTMLPVRDFACTALAEAAKRDEGRDHPAALRYVVGLREGALERKAALIAARAERAAAGEPEH